MITNKGKSNKMFSINQFILVRLLEAINLFKHSHPFLEPTSTKQ
jgi:hypothetical protein